MPIPFTGFPVLVKENILDLLDCYDLYSFSEASKRSRFDSQRSAKRHEGNMSVALNPKYQCLALAYKSSTHPQSDREVILELNDSKFENLEKYLSIRHSSLFVNVTISISHWYSAPFDFTFTTIENLARLGYPLKKCYMTGIGSNEAIVRALMTCRKAECVDMSMEPTVDFKNFDFFTPFPESLENELLEIHCSRWVSAWHINNVFNKCREVRLIDRGFPFAEPDVIEILKNWRIESSIRILTLTVDLDGSIEEFGAKMVEINARPVQEAASSMSMKRQRRRGYVSSAWLLKQNSSGSEVLITLGGNPLNGKHKDFCLSDEFELVPENL